MRGLRRAMFLLAAFTAFAAAVVTFCVLPAEHDTQVGGKTLILTGMIAVALGFSYMAWQAKKPN